ncbi:MAG: IPExxxVDY family protein, partial [Flavobacteriaceae bacterium]
EGLLADYPFESYEWINPIKGIEIRLFSNRYLKFRDEVQKGGSLFDLPETKELYLVQDLKDVDYIIKIDSGIEDQVMIERMESIDQVSYRYLIDQSQLKIDLSLNLY